MVPRPPQNAMGNKKGKNMHYAGNTSEHAGGGVGGGDIRGGKGGFLIREEVFGGGDMKKTRVVFPLCFNVQ